MLEKKGSPLRRRSLVDLNVINVDYRVDLKENDYCMISVSSVPLIGISTVYPVIVSD